MSSPRTGSAGSAEIIRSRPEDGQMKATPESFDPIPATVEPPVQEERALPLTGMTAVRYSIAKSLNPNARQPKLTKKELALIAQREEEERQRADLELRTCRYHESLNQLRMLGDRVGTATIAFFGVSGSAATTTNVVNSAAVFAEMTRTIVACSDFNPANGTAAARLGKDYGETLSVRDFRRLVKEGKIQNPSQLTSLLRPTVNGVRVLGANDRTSEAGEVESTVLDEMLDLIGRVFEFHYIDTANDTGTASMRKILERCDLPVFTANVDERKSLQLLGTSMEIARKTPGMRHKTNNSVVVISRLPEGDDLSNYRKFLNRVNIHEVVTSEYEFNGQMLKVHETDALAHNAAVDLTKLQWDLTMQEYIDVNIAILQQIILLRTDNGRGVTQ